MQLAVLKQWTLTDEMELTPRTPAAQTTGLKRKSPFEGAYNETEVKSIFDAARDSKAAQNICNHCGQPFGEYIGLRRHIELVRCKRFRADRPPQPWILQYQDPVMRLMAGLHPEQWLCEREFVARLKKECAFCGRHFYHFKGLQLHLTNKHPDGAQKAGPYAEHILNYYQPMGEACLYGHWLNSGKGILHTCVVALQLGMLRNKCKDETPNAQHIMIPGVIDHWLLHGHHDRVPAHLEYEHKYCSLCLNRHETPALL